MRTNAKEAPGTGKWVISRRKVAGFIDIERKLHYLRRKIYFEK